MLYKITSGSTVTGLLLKLPGSNVSGDPRIINSDYVIRRKYLLNELTVDDSFIRWASGEASPEESRRWDQWVEYSEANRNLAIRAQRYITGIRFDRPAEGRYSSADPRSEERYPESDDTSVSGSDLQDPLTLSLHREKDWERVKGDIMNRQADKAGSETESPEHRRSVLHKGQSAGSFVRLAEKQWSAGLLIKAAAIFIVLATAGLVAFYALNSSGSAETEQLSAAMVTVATEYSEKKTLSLTDGSEIILAAGSRISYREDWLQQPTIRVTLEEGEAYFSIIPDEDSDRSQPRFEVETQDGMTAVLGTRFSVTTYGEGTQVVLEKGEVRVTPSQSEGEEVQAAVTLQPGEMARWSKADTAVMRTRINPRVYTSWVSDHLYFDDTPLSFLVDRIEKTYGVDVVVVDPALLSLKLSGAVDFYGLDELAGAISEVLDIQLRHADNQVFLTR